MTETPDELQTDEGEAEEPITEEQVAEAEADDEPDEEEADAPEPTEEPPAAISEKELEKASKSLETSVKTYLTAVERFTERTAQTLYRDGVSLGGIPGFIFDPLEVPLTEEQFTAAKVLAGAPIEPPFEHDPLADECPTCKGWGKVKTGSKVHGRGLAQCNVCKGYGFVGDRLVQETRAGGTVTLLPPTSAAEESGPALMEDNWGTPLGHPDYGKLPQYREPGWAEALAAYKSGQAPSLTA